MASLILEIAKQHEDNMKSICKILFFELHEKDATETDLSKFSCVDSFGVKEKNHIIQTEIHYDHIYLGNIFLIYENSEFQTVFIPKNQL